MAFLFGDDYDAVFIDISDHVQDVKQKLIRLKSPDNIYNKYNMTDIFEYLKNIKPFETQDSTTIADTTMNYDSDDDFEISEISQETNEQLLKTYKDNNLIPFSFTFLQEALNDKGVAKKKLSDPFPAHQYIKKYEDKRIDLNKNGLAIRTGVKIDSDHYNILIDIDTPDDTIIKWFDFF